MNATRSRRATHLPPPPSHRSGPSLLRDWRAQPLSLRLLRAFLGVTFLYAGVQKLADPNFLHAGTPDYIRSQLLAFAQGSPIGGLLRVLAHAPLLTGLTVAAVEIAIGLGTLVGVAPIAFAAGGFLVNLTLTLSATWHVHPYFLGSDSMYAVAWLAYLVGIVEVRRRSSGARSRPAAPTPGGIGRRELLRGGVLVGATLLVAGVAAAGKRAEVLRSSGGPAPGSGVPSSPSASGPSPAPAPRGTPIASLSSIPVGGAIGFTDPGVGPAALVRLGPNDVVAFSRVCTHAGCLVGYDPARRILYCPCHGAEYDPSREAEVIAGPAPRPLQPIAVQIDRATGQVILPS